MSALAVLSACAGAPDRASPRVTAGGVEPYAESGPVKIGRPYRIRGRWYRPEDDRDYRETGTASWYGPNFHGKPTANGERFDQNAVSAAHRTLPLPSWVRVENLDNGREITVRVNDRGPFAHNRIIDLSRRAAQLLDMQRAGVARVRVTRIYPGDTRTRRDPPPAPARVASAPASVVSSDYPAGPRTIQVAALSDPRSAGRLMAALAEIDGALPAATETAPSGLIRVRMGPFRTSLEAETVLARLHAAGYADARLISTPSS